MNVIQKITPGILVLYLVSCSDKKSENLDSSDLISSWHEDAETAEKQLLTSETTFPNTVSPNTVSPNTVSPNTVSPNTAITLPAIDDTRILDGIGDHTTDGIGDEFRITTSSFVGHYHNGVNVHSAIVFQLTGVTDPSQITTANLRALQNFGKTQFSSTTFNVTANIARSSSNSDFLVSDHQTSALQLSANFNGNNSVGAVSLNAEGQAALGSWLRANYVEGEYVFISLQSDRLLQSKKSTRGLAYTNLTIDISIAP